MAVSKVRPRECTASELNHIFAISPPTRCPSDSSQPERESIALRSIHRNLLCAVGIVLRDEITRIFHPVRQGAAFRHAAPVHNPGRTARDRDLGVHVDNRHPGNHSCRGSCRRAVGERAGIEAKRTET